VFCKKVDLSSTHGALCTVSVFFYFTFYLFGGLRTHMHMCTHPPAYGPGISVRKSLTVHYLTDFLLVKIELLVKILCMFWFIVSFYIMYASTYG